MTNSAYIRQLFGRYIHKTATADEKEELMLLLADPLYEKVFQEINESFMVVPRQGVKVNDATTEEIWQALQTVAVATPVKSMIRRRIYSVWKVAAAVALLAVAGIGLWLENSTSVPAKNKTAGSVIKAGHNGAVLTLGNGQTVVLDSMSNGLVATESGTIVSLDDGQLKYNPNTSASSADDIVYNTMSTPRGRQFRLQLPDGTGVWLNAASSIRYPAVFTGSERRVIITGEAYFEVVAKAEMPFIVEVPGKEEIRVLGTHFNVNAYTDEPAVKTTLLEGSVRVVPDAGVPALLHPHEQYVLTGNKSAVQEADVEAVVAWINGMFYFKSADLQMVFRQIARWYDVDVRYNASVHERFSGNVYRTESINELLKIIEYTSNVSCTIQQKTIIVSPKTTKP